MRRAGAAVVILGVFLALGLYAADVIALLLPQATGFVRWDARMALEVLGCLVAVMALYRTGVLQALRNLALIRPVHTALLFGLVSTLPMLLTFGVASSWTPAASALDLLHYTVLSPLAEEILYRGFAFWMLYRYARLGFWASALLPAIVFAADHVDLSGVLSEQLGIVAITGLGSIWVCWLLVKWQNLWVPIWIHVLMNGWWMLFDAGDTAFGDGAGNIARVATVVVSIALTRWRYALFGAPAGAAEPGNDPR